MTTRTGPASTTATSTREGGRSLGGFHATMLVMGGIVGVGIFFTPRDVAQLVPDPLAFLGVWVAGAAIAMAGAATFAELGATFPRSGGWYEFLREIYGPRTAFLFAWVILGVVATGAIAVIAGFGATMLAGLVPGIGPPGTGSHLLLAAAILVAIHALVLAGIRVGAVFQSGTMVAKLAGILLLAVAGLVLFAPEGAGSAGGAEAGGAPRAGPWSGPVAALLPALFAFGGWQHLCYVAGEVRDPRRTLPRAILLGVLGVGIVYLLANLAFLRVLGAEGIAGDPDFAADAARLALGERGGLVLRAVMAVSAIGVCTVNVIVTPQILVAMARSGLFPRAFARLHPRTGAPVLALGVQLALALAYLFWSHAEAWLPLERGADAFDADALVGSVVFAEWIFHGATAWGLVRLRRRRPDLPRPWRSPLFPLAPLAYLAAAVLVVPGNVVASPWTRTAVGLGVLALGALIYAPWRRTMGRAAGGT